MKTRSKISILASSVIFTLFQTESAFSAVINFSSLSQAGSGFSNLGTTVTQDGYEFISTPGSYGIGTLGVWQDASPNHPSGGTQNTSLAEYYADAQTTMTATNNSPFQLNGIDLAPWGSNQNGTMVVTFVGTKSDNSQVKQIFTVNNSNGSTPVLQNFTFNGFTDLVNVKFIQGFNPSSTAYQFNNIVVNAVPEPEEYAMMLLGFGMVGYQIKRKQRKTTPAVA